MKKILEYKSVYPYAQGFTITDRFIYIMNIVDNQNEKAARYDKFTMKRLGAQKFTGLVRHGNDLTWNSFTKEVLCAAGGGSNEIIVFDEMLQYKRTVKVPFEIVSLSGLAFDPVSKLYSIYGGNNKTIYIVNDITDKKPLYTFKHQGTKNFQGMAMRGHAVYVIYSSGKIELYTVEGELIQNSSVGTFNECENIELLNDKLFFNVSELSTEKTQLYYTPLNTITNNIMIC